MGGVRAELESELSKVGCDRCSATASRAIFLRWEQRSLRFQLEVLSILFVLLREDSVKDWVDVWCKQIHIEELDDMLVS